MGPRLTDDAIVDFTPMGGRVESPADIQRRLISSDTWLLGQHPVNNLLVELNDDSATAYSEYTMQTGRRSDEAGKFILISGGGSYVDQLRRTDLGWRIQYRTVSLKWRLTRVVVDEIKR